MRSVIARIATGPELGRSISREDARVAMGMVLDGTVHPVQAGVFLIALRMKRETDDENAGILAAIVERTRRVEVAADDIADVADPYDGFDRCLPASPFLPAVLAACGLPAVTHGVRVMGPKFGVTVRQVLEAAGAECGRSMAEVAARVADAGVGWGYLDQRVSCPPLYALADLRRLIVKRPALTTLEKLARPLTARLRTHLLTGYVHKAYPPVYTAMAKLSGYHTALVVRGVEGGVVASLRQASPWRRFEIGSEDAEGSVVPGELGIACDLRAPGPTPPEPAGSDNQRPLLAAAAARAGLDALGGVAGASRDALVLAAALALWSAGRSEAPAVAAAQVRAALDSGRALAAFRAGC